MTAKDIDTIGEKTIFTSMEKLSPNEPYNPIKYDVTVKTTVEADSPEAAIVAVQSACRAAPAFADSSITEWRESDVCSGCGYDFSDEAEDFGPEESSKCKDCGDCEECCDENHGGRPHAPGAI